MLHQCTKRSISELYILMSECNRLRIAESSEHFYYVVVSTAAGSHLYTECTKSAN